MEKRNRMENNNAGIIFFSAILIGLGADLHGRGDIDRTFFAGRAGCASTCSGCRNLYSDRGSDLGHDISDDAEG